MAAFNKVITDNGGYNLAEFFGCTPAEFKQYYQQPWEQYKAENR